jgi:hypothetical protein
VFINVFRIGIGISSTISMSNTMKIIANMKNRSENGTRALFFGSNPHSNGEVFSRSLFDRILSTLAIENTKTAINSAKVAVITGTYITQKYIIFSFD